MGVPIDVNVRTNADASIAANLPGLTIIADTPDVPQDHEEIPPPCFFWKSCSERAAMEKSGRSVCRRCARSLQGIEYPLRNPSSQPTYITGRAAAEAMDMVDDD